MTIVIITYHRLQPVRPALTLLTHKTASRAITTAYLTCPKFIPLLSLWCYVLKDRVYMTWVQYSITIVPAVYSLLQHSHLHLWSNKAYPPNSHSSFVVHAFVYFFRHVIIGTVTVSYNMRSLLTASHYYKSLPLAKSSSHLHNL
jgi:hypothetical protein